MKLHTSKGKSFPTAVKPRPASANLGVSYLRLIIFLLLAAFLLAACGGSDAPASDAEEAPAAADTVTPAPEPDPTDTPVPIATLLPDPTDTPAPEPEPTNTPEAEPEPPPTAAPMEASESAEAPGMGQTFVIAAEESEARFSIDEELFGQPKTVVGVTNAISGEIRVDAANPGASVIGPIQIEAGTFVTDNDRRNRAIRRFILQSNRYQYITFSSTELSGMPESVAVGDEIEFEVIGDLTVREVTNPVLFIVTLRVISESELWGSAATILVLDNFELTIPEVPSVANVGEEFIVEFDFVARAQ
ncbi:MAG: YceI family protein [Caldilineaceae bacterium]|nr:YceI family protein [Caldilineaceae bacterium]